MAAPLPPVLLTSSGTGGLEIVLASFLHKKTKVLVLSAGTYGNLLARLAFFLSPDTTVLEFTQGTAIDPEILEKHFAMHNSSYDAVLFTHSESSTGVYNPAEKISEAIRANANALIFMDAISSIGASWISMKELDVDAIIGASQKGLMSPPGLAFAYLSHKAREMVVNAKQYPPYMHLKPWLEAQERQTTPYTPPVNLIAGLQKALEMISSEGLNKRFKRHAMAATICQNMFSSAGIRLFPERHCAGNSITAVRLPRTLKASSIKKKLEMEYQIQVSTGLGSFTDQVIRVGHMGHFTLEQVKSAVEILIYILK